MGRLIFRGYSGTVLDMVRENIDRLAVSIEPDHLNPGNKKGVVDISTNRPVGNVSHHNIRFSVSPLEAARILSWYLYEEETGEDMDYQIGLIEQE